MLKIKSLWIVSLLLVTVFLQGCTSSDTSDTKNGISKEEDNSIQEITLYPEDYITGSLTYKYRYAGFINENTIAFQEVLSRGYASVYHPAEVGYRFTLSSLSEVKEFEILEVNRMEGTIKLKITTTN